MPLFAKILAILNVLAAGLFIYLAAIDWDQRQKWSREVFRHEIVLGGIPVDEQDFGSRVDRPLVMDLGGEGDEGPVAILNDLFRSSGGKAIKTQDREVERVRQETMKEIDGLADEKEQRKRLKDLLLSQAQTYDQHERLLVMIADQKVTNDQLKALLNDQFLDVLRDVSLTENRDVILKKRLIAHLLYNLSTDPNVHQRVMVVVGLRTYVAEADNQARALREMVERTKSAALDEQLGFEAEFVRQRDRILALSQQIDRQKANLKNLEDLYARQQKEIIAPLAERKVQLKKELAKAKDDTTEVLHRQDGYERELFKIHRQIGELMDENSKLERDIRILELGRLRGGQR